MTRNVLRTTAVRLGGALAVSAVLALLALVAPAGAFARTERLDVVVAADMVAQRPTFFATGTLSSDTALPASISFAVPRGGLLTWSGQVIPGATDEDMKLQPTVVKGERYDIVTLTLTRSRTGHVQSVMQGDLPPAGTPVAPTVSYTMLDDVSSASVGIEVPAGSEVTSATPGAQTKPGADGSTLYYLEASDLNKGDVVPLKVSFTPPGPVVTDTPSSLLPAFLLVVGVPVIFVVVRHSMKRRASKA